MNCAKCNRDVGNAKDMAKCVDCQSYYHAGCCRIRTLAKLTAMSARSLASWKCDECSQDSSSVNSKSDSEDPKVTELLMSMKQYMEQHFETIENQLAGLQSSHEDLKQRLNTVEIENNTLKSECENLKKTNLVLQNRVGWLEGDLAELQQYSRNHNVEIRGVPATKNEDVYVILRAIAKALSIEYRQDAISIAHRLPTPRGNKFPPSIVVQFISRAVRATWINAAKQKKIQTTDLAPSLAPGPIFILDHLTARNKALLLRAKQLMRHGYLAFAWCRDGKILIRKTPDSKAHRVTTVDEVEDIAGVRGASGSEAESGNVVGGKEGVKPDAPPATENA